ncbi:MAG: DUF192 domain-containing protein [Candidatus Hadarchaeales archaeon]
MPALKIAGGKVLARDLVIDRTRIFLGLMFRRKMDDDWALILEPSKEGRHLVHTFFVSFPVDLVFTDSSMRVVEIKTNLNPWRLYLPRRRFAHLIELPGGKISATGLRVGDKLVLEKVISMKLQK